MPSGDRQIVFPMPVGGRVRWTASVLILAVGLVLFGATAIMVPEMLAGAALAVAVMLGFLGIVGEESSPDRERGSASQRQDTGTSSTVPGQEDDPVTLLKRRYAAGEMSDEEFDRRVERLVALDGLGDAADEREVERAR